MPKIRWPQPEEESLTGTDSEAPGLPWMKSNVRLYYESPWRRPLVLGALGAVAVAGVILAVVCGRRGGAAAQDPQSPKREMLQQVMGLGRFDDGDWDADEDVSVIGDDAAAGRPATSLFHDAEVQELATESIMLVGADILRRRDRHLVRAAVGTGFRNMSVQIETRAGEAFSQLERIRLNATQARAVLGMMRLIGDERVRSIGVDVGQAMHDAGTSQAKAVQQAVEAKLESRLEEIREARDELVPKALREIWRGSNQWEMTLDPENIRIMGPYRRGKFAALAASNVFGVQTVEETPFNKMVYGILGGVLEEGRALIHVFGLIAQQQDWDIRVPTWVTALGGNLAVTSQDLNCEHHFNTEIEIKLMKAVFCPLKFGTMGLEAMRALSEDGRSFRGSTAAS